MSKNKPLHDGSKIYDTPRCYNPSGLYMGYNGCFDSGYPTYAVGSNCKYTAYWERQLFRRTMAIMEFEVPAEWDKDYFLWVLFRCGFIGIVETQEYGVIPQYCTFHGRNVYYMPTRLLLANPRINQHNFTIHENCEVLKLNPDYTGAWDIIHEYAEQLGLLTQSLHMAIVNTRLTDGYVTNSNSAAQTIRTMLQLIDDGMPSVVLNSKAIADAKINESTGLPWYEIHNDVGKNYIIDKIISDMESTLNAFCREIGVPVLSDKKERQLTSEVNVTVGAAMTAVDVWFDTLNRCIETINKHWPDLHLAVRKEDYKEDDNNDESAVQSPEYK